MTTAAAGTARTRWGIVALGFACGVVGMFQTAKMSVALIEVQRDIGLSLVAASWSITVVSLTGALFGVQAGRITSEFGAARTLAAALMISAVAALATALIADPAWFFAARLTEGIGYLLVCAAAPAMMAEHAAPRDRGLALAIWGAFVPVSVSIMAVAGPPVILEEGWRMLFLASAATAVVALVVVLAAVGGGRLRGGAAGAGLARVLASAPADFAVLYRAAGPMGLAIAFMVFAGMQVGFIALQPSFLVDARGLSLADAGIVLSATTPFAILGTVIAGVLLGLGAGGVPMAVAGFVGMAAGGGMSFLAPPQLAPLILAGAVFYTAGGVVASVVFASLPARTAPGRDLALLSGLMVQFGNIGALLGAPILAAVASLAGWGAAPWAISGMAAAGVAGMLMSRR